LILIFRPPDFDGFCHKDIRVACFIYQIITRAYYKESYFKRKKVFIPGVL